MTGLKHNTNCAIRRRICFALSRQDAYGVAQQTSSECLVLNLLRGDRLAADRRCNAKLFFLTKFAEKTHHIPSLSRRIFCYNALFPAVKHTLIYVIDTV